MYANLTDVQKFGIILLEINFYKVNINQYRC